MKRHIFRAGEGRGGLRGGLAGDAWRPLACSAVDFGGYRVPNELDTRHGGTLWCEVGPGGTRPPLTLAPGGGLEQLVPRWPSGAPLQGPTAQASSRWGRGQGHAPGGPPSRVSFSCVRKDSIISANEDAGGLCLWFSIALFVTHVQEAAGGASAGAAAGAGQQARTLFQELGPVCSVMFVLALWPIHRGPRGP